MPPCEMIQSVLLYPTVWLFYLTKHFALFNKCFVKTLCIVLSSYGAALFHLTQLFVSFHFVLFCHPTALLFYSGTSIFLRPHATTHWMGFDPRTLYACISAYGHMFCVYYAKHDSLEIHTAKYLRYSHLRISQKGIRINSL